MGARRLCGNCNWRQWLGVPQPDISRWLKYWQAGDWANLLSLHSAEVLTAELVGRIVEVCATFPTWGVARVYQHLRQQGVAVTEPQVQQAVEQSGWRRLQQTLGARYDLSGPALALRDGWLVGQLLAQVRELLGRLEAGQATRGRSAHHAGRLDGTGPRSGCECPTAGQDLALAATGRATAVWAVAVSHGRPGALSGLWFRPGRTQERHAPSEEVL